MKYVAVERNTEKFQQPLHESQISALARRALGSHIEVQTSQLLTSGKFNTSYKLVFADRAPVVLRVAPPLHATVFQHEHYLLRRESSIQPILNSICSETPVNLFMDFSHNLIDRDYVVQKWMPGELWDTIKDDLSDSENSALWKQLGGMVKAIHAVPGNRYGVPAPLPGHARWGEAVIDELTAIVEDMQRYRLPCDDGREFLERVRGCQRCLDEINQPTLVHGDLWLKNILIERHRDGPKISALLDVERAFWAEPAAEWIFSFLDIPDSFWQVYGTLPQTESAQVRQRIYEGRGALQLCLEAWRFGFEEGFARDMLQRVIESLPVSLRRPICSESTATTSQNFGILAWRG